MTCKTRRAPLTENRAKFWMQNEASSAHENKTGYVAQIDASPTHGKQGWHCAHQNDAGSVDAKRGGALTCNNADTSHAKRGEPMHTR
ncbi:hypothetical protein DVH24_036750 [Malus domestica]|uniref:Uncharacterized protein n=1 Tax=Malus domestica TaxID=3750 RepID=A0A498IH51_MALDO|nr:hypothetical protein DVH24_036750 [Malus domestica]